MNWCVSFILFFFFRLHGLVQTGGPPSRALEWGKWEWCVWLYVAGVCAHIPPHSTAPLTALEPRSGRQAAESRSADQLSPKWQATAEPIHLEGSHPLHPRVGGLPTLPPISGSPIKFSQRQRNWVTVATRARTVWDVSLEMALRKSAQPRSKTGADGALDYFLGTETSNQWPWVSTK